MLSRNGFSPHVVQEADSIPQIFTMVACGCGIAVLSELYRFSAGEHVVFVPLRDIPPSEEHLLWRRGMTSA
ncbi:MAG: LysR substrate-binding domain-containing protein [Flavonifractor plautii]